MKNVVRKLMLSLAVTLMLMPIAALAQSGKSCTTNADCASPESCLDSNHKPGAGNCGIFCKPGVLDCPSGMTCQDIVSGGNGLCKTPPPPSPTPGTDQTQSGQVVNTGPITLKNPLNVSTVPELVSSILKAMIGMVGALALLVFVYGGFLWLTSGGEEGKIRKGKDAMKWAAIGLVVIFTSYALVSFVFKAITG